MFNIKTIQIKATFLLVVFAFNMVVGFACGIGIDMGFNTVETHAQHKYKIHVHADGKKHEHKATHSHSKHHHEKKSHDEKEGGCCSDGVVKIAQADKAIVHTETVSHPIFFTDFIAAYYHYNIFYESQITEPSKYFVRGHHPPIQDIRIAIQSFQI